MFEERTIYRITEDLIQSAAEANLGRELTETELKRLPCVFIDNGHFFDAVYCGLVEVAEEAMKKEGWNKWDKEHKDVPLTDV